MSRQAREDKRSKPTKDPNPHYWADNFFKHIKFILAFIILLICLFMIYSDGLIDEKIDAIQSIAWMCAGFLFGTTTSK